MPPASLLPVLAKAIDDQLRIAEKAASDSGPDGIHDLRVATRRLRAALELWLAVDPEKKLDRNRKTLRKLGKRLGALRETDVDLRELLELRDAHPPYAPAAEIVAASEMRRRRRRERRLSRELGRIELPDLAREIRSVAEAALDSKSGGEPVDSTARRELRERLPRLRSLLDRALRSPTPRNLHRLRIDLKKFRYSVELCAPAYDGRRAPQLIRRLKNLQDALGSAHDADALHARIAALRADFRRDGLPAIERLMLSPMRAVAVLSRERRNAAVRELQSCRRQAFFSRFPAAVRREAAGGYDRD